MAKVHVLLKKEELDTERLTDKVVVVLDILFATSTMVAALAHGASEVIPALDGTAALAVAATLPADSYVLSGELNAETLPGFAHPTPLALMQDPLQGRTLVYSTTNGTVALGKSAGARHIYAGSLLNARAIVAHVCAAHADQTVLIVCSGSADNFNLEDFYGAGYFVALFREQGGWEFSDAALAAGMLHDGTDALACLRAARVGRMMLERRLDAELDYAAGKDRFPVVPELIDGRLRLVSQRA